MLQLGPQLCQSQRDSSGSEEEMEDAAEEMVDEYIKRENQEAEANEEEKFNNASHDNEPREIAEQPLGTAIALHHAAYTIKY